MNFRGVAIDGDRGDAARRRNMRKVSARFFLVDGEIVMKGQQRRWDHARGAEILEAFH
ncbi:MAG: hypothetical protein NVS2B5_02770 [Beijerinckiaceae bacterium]